MYTLTETKARSIEPDAPPGHEPIYGVVQFSESSRFETVTVPGDPPDLFRFILVLDRTGGMLCHVQERLHLN